jgi:hypothetical protein
MHVSPVVHVYLVKVPLIAVALPAGLSTGGKADIIKKLKPELFLEEDWIPDGNHDPVKVMVVQYIE